MRKGLLLLVGIAVLWVPAVSFGGDSSSKPAGKTETPRAKSNASNPAKTCKGQDNRTNAGKGHGAAANAFGKCVSSIAKHKAENDGKDSSGSTDKDENQGNESAKSHDKTESHGEDATSPAMTCKAMQGNDLAQFQTAYGTDPNAFGKCVAGHANGKNQQRADVPTSLR